MFGAGEKLGFPRFVSQIPQKLPLHSSIAFAVLQIYFRSAADLFSPCSRFLFAVRQKEFCGRHIFFFGLLFIGFDSFVNEKMPAFFVMVKDVYKDSWGERKVYLLKFMGKSGCKFMHSPFYVFFSFRSTFVGIEFGKILSEKGGKA